MLIKSSFWWISKTNYIEILGKQSNIYSLWVIPTCLSIFRVMWGPFTWPCDTHPVMWGLITWPCDTHPVMWDHTMWSCDSHLPMWGPIMWSCDTHLTMWGLTTWSCDTHLAMWGPTMWSCDTHLAMWGPTMWSCDDEDDIAWSGTKPALRPSGESQEPVGDFGCFKE